MSIIRYATKQGKPQHGVIDNPKKPAIHGRPWCHIQLGPLPAGFLALAETPYGKWETPLLLTQDQLGEVQGLLTPHVEAMVAYEAAKAGKSQTGYRWCLKEDNDTGYIRVDAQGRYTLNVYQRCQVGPEGAKRDARPPTCYTFVGGRPVPVNIEEAKWYSGSELILVAALRVAWDNLTKPCMWRVGLAPMEVYLYKVAAYSAQDSGPSVDMDGIPVPDTSPEGPQAGDGSGYAEDEGAPVDVFHEVADEEPQF